MMVKMEKLYKTTKKDKLQEVEERVWKEFMSMMRKRSDRQGIPCRSDLDLETLK